MATIRQYSQRTDRELRAVLERARQDPSFRIGSIQDEFDIGRESRLFRTDTNAITTTYPTFGEEKGFQLPCKLLKTTYVSGDPNPVTVATVTDSRSWYMYSPYGWIPRYIDIHCTLNYGLWVPTYVPELEVTLSGSIVAGNSGTVEIVNHGAANGQTLTAWFDHMATGTASSGKDARIALMPGEKKWRIVELQC